MSVYTRGDNSQNGEALTQSETHLYGSSRIGLFKPNLNVEMPSITRKINFRGVEPGYFLSFERGRKIYELSNHLGNVLATVSDRRIALDADQNGIVDYYSADVLTTQDYYSGGMQMPGRTYQAGSGSYTYGYGGHLKADEIYGDGNMVDMGGRFYDTRIGRTPSPDPEKHLYTAISPYAYALDNPINVIDPDGKLVIFINGQHLGNQGGTRSYWGGVDKKIMSRIGDYRAIYRDGASGGFPNTIFNQFPHNNLNPLSRIASGYARGKKDAASVIAGLKRDPNDPNKITETIKVVTHSMGTAYSRGYTAALEQYVSEYNAKHKDAPLTGFQIETQVDIAAFQGSMLPADQNVKNRFFMSGDADWVANGKGKHSLKSLSPSSDVPNATPIKTDPGTTHDVTDYGKDKYLQQIPQSTNNSDVMPVQMPQPSQRAPADATRVAPKPIVTPIRN